MLPLIGSLISGGASLLGGMFSSQTSAANTQATIQANQASQAEAENFNAGQAQLNRDFQSSQVQQQEDFQQQMSNTAYQRASSDMKAAGLNPMMMFGSGSAASAPSGAAASGSSASISPMKYDYSGRTSPLAGLGDAVKNGVSTMVDAKTIEMMGQKIANMQADKSLTDARAGGQSQQNIINLPAETTAQSLNEWMRKHPELVTAGEVTKYGAKAIGDAAGAAGEVIGAAGKGVGGALKGWSKSDRFPTKQEDMSVGFSSNAKTQLIRRGMELERSNKSSINSAGGRPTQEMIDNWKDFNN